MSVADNENSAKSRSTRAMFNRFASPIESVWSVCINDHSNELSGKRWIRSHEVGRQVRTVIVAERMVCKPGDEIRNTDGLEPVGPVGVVRDTYIFLTTGGCHWPLRITSSGQYARM
jgi:hypothetical protein